MRALVFTPDRDTPGRSDWRGAFRVEAERLLTLHALPSWSLVEVPIVPDLERRRRQVLEALQRHGREPLHLVAFLCHGWRQGLQLGFRTAHAPQLAAALAGACVRALALYACSTAADAHDEPGTAGDGGFADLLRDSWSRCVGPDGAPCRSFHIDAHDRAGHCTSNPYVRRFEGAAGPAAGGAWLVEPGSPRWGTWSEQLADRHGSPLRLQYPLLSREELARHLGG